MMLLTSCTEMMCLAGIMQCNEIFFTTLRSNGELDKQRQEEKDQTATERREINKQINKEIHVIKKKKLIRRCEENNINKNIHIFGMNKVAQPTLRGRR